MYFLGVRIIQVLGKTVFTFIKENCELKGPITKSPRQTCLKSWKWPC